MHTSIETEDLQHEVLWNNEVKQLLKGKFRRSIECDEFDKKVLKSSNMNTKLNIYSQQNYEPTA